MQRWQRAATVLHAMQGAVTEAAGDPDRIMQVVVDLALAAFEVATGASIETVDGDRLVYRASSGIATMNAGVAVPLGSSLSGLCVRTGQPQICHDSERDARVDRAACRRIGLRSMVVVPLPLNGPSAGVLKILSDVTDAFDDRDISIAELLIAPIAYGLAAASADRAHRMFEATFEQAAVGIAHVGLDGGFLRVNARFSAIAGYSNEELIAGGFQQITHPDDLMADLAQFEALLADRIRSYELEKRYIRKDGSIVWINLTVSLVRHADGTPDFFVGVIEDISRRKDAEALASFDPLTGLPNRRRLMDELDRLLDHQVQAPADACVAFLDLDRFKAVNDRLGHAEGDRCLVAVAAALLAAVRTRDVVGRLAGDEFVLLMRGCAAAEVTAILDRLRTTVNDAARGGGWDIGVSAGAVIVRGGACHSRARVLEMADACMYRAKRSRVGRIVVELANDAAAPGGVERKAVTAPR